jgi:thiol-disulfide isomerase/thioredoxin
MSAIRLVVLAIVLAACAPFAPPTSAPRPDAWSVLESSRDLDGQVVGDPMGRKTVAIVFASWCEHCHETMAALASLRARPDVRIVGVNFRWQEEYDARGDAAAVRAYVSREAPWMRVVPGDEHLWSALGAPPKVPTIYVYDASGRLAAVYDRRARPSPEEPELAALLDRL